jgi:hypothetical protein
MKTIEELECSAYIAGDTTTADLLARIDELESQVASLEEQIEDTETLESWERNHGSAQAYWAFFHGCFARLDGHYPCPSVTSDHDYSVIFAAIERGEGVTE